MAHTTSKSVLQPDILQDLECSLHDLCQPLTTLHCRLELGKMYGDHDSLLESVQGGLSDLATVFQMVSEMRGHLERQTDNGTERA